jgi:hypothetical protein
VLKFSDLEYALICQNEILNFSKQDFIGKSLFLTIQLLPRFGFGH